MNDSPPKFMDSRRLMMNFLCHARQHLLEHSGHDGGDMAAWKLLCAASGQLLDEDLPSQAERCSA